MSPKSPSSPEGSGLPPRHRPNSSNLAKDTTEGDLWAFDDLDPEPAPPAPQEAAPADTRPASIPAPRNRLIVRKSDDPPPPPVKGSVSVNVGKARKEQSPEGRAPVTNDFDDLDSWDQTGPADDFALPPEPVEPADEIPAVAKIPEPVEAPIATDDAEIAPDVLPETEPAAEDADDDELNPHAPANAVPVTFKMLPKLSKFETAGLVSLVAAAALIAGLFWFFAIHKLPKGHDRAKSADFPKQGSKVVVESADTYWRSPKSGDTARRGTLLLPVLDLELQGGPAALRVLFRNSDGEPVGDSITRSVQANGKMELAATAGFDDYGMHAAYRTGQTQPWTVEVREAPSETSSPKEFKKLFEMNISTDRR